MTDWIPGLSWNPFDAITNSVTDMVRLALEVVVLLVVGLFLLSGKGNAVLTPLWSRVLGIACLIASFYLIAKGGF